MKYTNSPLVTFTKLSPNHSGQRVHSIDRITPHCYVGQQSAETMASWLCNPQAKASANYVIDKDARIGLLVEEKNRSWCSSSNANDQRAITIECASDMTHPFAITDKVYNTLIKLMADICKRNGKKRITWLGDREKSLIYEPKSDEMLITVHRWFDARECPGEYIYSRLPQIAEEVNKLLGYKEPEWYRIRLSWEDVNSQVGAYEDLENAKQVCPAGYSVFNSKGKAVYTVPMTSAQGIPNSKQNFIDKVSTIAKALYKNTKILPSVVIAQCCLETGYGLGVDALELVKRNNLLGMKSELLNKTWKTYSVWSGESFNKNTPEVKDGKVYYKPDNFRVYIDYENCIRDYEMFLLHVKDSDGYKYRKVSGMTNAKDVITAISKGGYATDPNYITKILKLIEENNFTKYDKELGISENISLEPAPIPELSENEYYRVQVGSFAKKSGATKFAKTVNDKGFPTTIKKGDDVYRVQVGAYKRLANAKKKLEELKAAGFTDAFITS